MRFYFIFFIKKFGGVGGGGWFLIIKYSDLLIKILPNSKSDSNKVGNNIQECLNVFLLSYFFL